jgi:Xaa-Pro aminopeptidase
MDYQARRQRLRRVMHKAGIPAMLVTHGPNVTYLTGFTGDSSYLLVRPGGETMISDGRYVTQIEEECPGLDAYFRKPGVGIAPATVKVLRAAGAEQLAIEADSMSVALRDKLAEKWPRLAMTPTVELVEGLRQIKDKDEIAEIRESIRCAEEAFATIRATIRPEQTEKDIADELDHQFRRLGGRCASFPPIVAVGPRAALPHATPTLNPVEDGDFTLIDWGADKRLYKSDLTRVLVTGRISPKLRRVYGVVLNAQARAIAAIRPGVTAHEVDAVARGVIADAGFGRCFKHGLGHGIGLEIHEDPRLAAKNPLVLKAGMVITVEPGIYLPGWGGIRLEDDVLITRRGHEVLTSVPKQLEEVVVG